jgi:hypothetical protein
MLRYNDYFLLQLVYNFEDIGTHKYSELMRFPVIPQIVPLDINA